MGYFSKALIENAHIDRLGARARARTLALVFNPEKEEKRTRKISRFFLLSPLSSTY